MSHSVRTFIVLLPNWRMSSNWRRFCLPCIFSGFVFHHLCFEIRLGDPLGSCCSDDLWCLNTWAGCRFGRNISSLDHRWSHRFLTWGFLWRRTWRNFRRSCFSVWCTESWASHGQIQWRVDPFWTSQATCLHRRCSACLRLSWGIVAGYLLASQCQTIVDFDISTELVILSSEDFDVCLSKQNHLYSIANSSCPNYLCSLGMAFDSELKHMMSHYLVPSISLVLFSLSMPAHLVSIHLRF